MKKRRPVLLVEDNPNDEYLIIKALREINQAIDIIVAHDGVEALDYLYSEGPGADSFRNEVPLIVFLDLKLPRVDGLEVLKMIREHERTKILPVVILTSSLEPRDLVKSYSLSANSYVFKPVDYLQFRNSIKQLSLYWLVLNKYPEF
jgi:CheY-like chemotaxis protein